jgi:hypothetical protein
MQLNDVVIIEGKNVHTKNLISQTGKDFRVVSFDERKVLVESCNLVNGSIKTKIKIDRPIDLNYLIKRTPFK